MSGAPVDPKQWVQPLFMIYDVTSDEKVPLTQERLDKLIATERQYGMMICSIRDNHQAHAIMLGYNPKPFAEVTS